MPLLHFQTSINSENIIDLPVEVSAKLPSRGMAMIQGALNGFPFNAAVEPNGKGSHWFKVSSALQEGARTSRSTSVSLSIEVLKNWPEPRVPVDLRKALDSDPEAIMVWHDITPMARWDWIRWIGATKVKETRMRRIEVTRSKLKAGTRRPCCFNRTECTLTDA